MIWWNTKLYSDKLCHLLNPWSLTTKTDRICKRNKHIMLSDRKLSASGQIMLKMCSWLWNHSAFHTIYQSTYFFFLHQHFCFNLKICDSHRNIYSCGMQYSFYWWSPITYHILAKLKHLMGQIIFVPLI